MKKQTAVEWLIEQLIPKAMATYDTTTYNAIEKAKAMEKEQQYAGSNYDPWDEVIDQLGDTNEMIDHIGDVNKMVKDDVEKLAEEYAEKKYGGGQSPSYFAGFTDGYNKAKETLYTEEQVIAIVEKSRATGLTAEYIIQSLKQPKP